MDKTWTMYRNQLFTPNFWFYDWMAFLIPILESNGWTLIGWGEGGFSGGGAYYWDRSGVTTPFSTSQTNCWACLQAPDNGDGKTRPEIVWQEPWSTNDLRMWVRHEGGYTNAGIDSHIRPTAGDGGEMGRTSTDLESNSGTAASRWTFCVASDGSYIAYSSTRNNASAMSAFVRCMDVEELDLYPYACFHRSSYNYQMIDIWQFSYQNGNASIMAYHPTAGDIWGNNGASADGYGIAKLYCGGGDIRPGIDPVTGEPTMYGMHVMSWGSYGHVKGRLPDMFYSGMANNDRVNSGEYIQCGHLMLPWGSDSEVVVP